MLASISLKNSLKTSRISSKRSTNLFQTRGVSNATLKKNSILHDSSPPILWKVKNGRETQLFKTECSISLSQFQDHCHRSFNRPEGTFVSKWQDNDGDLITVTDESGFEMAKRSAYKNSRLKYPLDRFNKMKDSDFPEEDMEEEEEEWAAISVTIP